MSLSIDGVLAAPPWFDFYTFSGFNAFLLLLLLLLFFLYSSSFLHFIIPYYIARTKCV